MIEPDAQEHAIATIPGEQAAAKQQPAWSWPMLLCVAAFVLCMLETITPLQRLVSTPYLTTLPTSTLLSLWGAWLPANFHWLPNAHDAFVSTNNLEFLFFIVLAFAIYGLFAFLTLRKAETIHFAYIQRLSWIGAIVAGLFFVFTPALLSRDIFVYADYGHTLLTSHANLYFVPPALVSHDQITLLDDLRWRYSTAAYGPVWLYISAMVAIFAGDHPLRYILLFRLLGFAAHLLNIRLVMSIMRRSGRSERIVTLGMVLYALNPLVLLESCLGGHNDIVMISFILLGILLCVRAEQGDFTRFKNYGPPILAFTLAALIKFTSGPLILFFLALLVRKTLLQPAPVSLSRRHRWRSALFNVCIAGFLSACIALVCYAPFWIGHSPTAIVHSFSTPASAQFAENSILRAVQGWIQLHGLPARSSWDYTLLTLLSDHRVWNALNLFVLAGAILAGMFALWRTPITHTLVLASLVTLGALLIVTPWFFAWYVTWLVALAAVSFTMPGKRLQFALIAFALVFSASAFSSYLVNGYPLFSNSGVMQSLRIFGIPLLVFCVALIVKWRFPGHRESHAKPIVQGYKKVDV